MRPWSPPWSLDARQEAHACTYPLVSKLGIAVVGRSPDGKRRRTNDQGPLDAHLVDERPTEEAHGGQHGVADGSTVFFLLGSKTSSVSPSCPLTLVIVNNLRDIGRLGGGQTPSSQAADGIGHGGSTKGLHAEQEHLGQAVPPHPPPQGHRLLVFGHVERALLLVGEAPRRCLDTGWCFLPPDIIVLCGGRVWLDF